MISKSPQFCLAIKTGKNLLVLLLLLLLFLLVLSLLLVFVDGLSITLLLLLIFLWSWSGRCWQKGSGTVVVQTSARAVAKRPNEHFHGEQVSHFVFFLFKVQNTKKKHNEHFHGEQVVHLYIFLKVNKNLVYQFILLSVKLFGISSIALD